MQPTAKGKTEPLRVWRLLEVHAEAEAVMRKLDSPMVGRAREQALRLSEEGEQTGALNDVATQVDWRAFERVGPQRAEGDRKRPRRLLGKR